MMRFAIGRLALGVLVGASALAVAQAPDLDNMDIVLRAVPAGPVASVNGESIDAEEFKELYRSELAHILSSGPNVEFTQGDRIQLGFLCLRRLIDRRILLQQAAKRKLTVSDADVDKAYNQQVEQLRKALTGGSDADVSEAQIMEALGATKEQVRKELRDALLVEKMRDTLLKEKNVTASSDELKTFYDEHKKQFMRPDMCHMGQIFFSAPPSTSTRKDAAQIRQQAKKKAEEALKRIQSGQSFEAVAREMSEGAFKDQGGDWGNVPAAKLPPFLLDAAYKMQPNEVSGVIESDFGCHIIKLLSITPGAEPDFDKIKPLIERQVLNTKGEEIVAEFCRDVMDKGGDLQVYLELEKSIALESGNIGSVKKDAP